MDDVLAVAHLLLWLLSVALLVRLAVSVVASFAPRWTPSGAALLLAEGVYTATDPIIKPLRKILPPLQLGGLRLDLTLMVALMAVYFASFLLR